MLFILGANFGISIVTALLISTRRKPVSADRWLIAAAAALALTTGGLGLARSGVDLPAPIAVFLGGPSFLVLITLLYYYVREAAGVLRSRDAVWLLPAIVHFVWLWTAGLAQGFHIYVGGFVWLTPGHYLAPLPLLFPFIVGLIYPLSAFREADRHLSRAKELFASVERLDLQWAAQLQLALLCLTASAVMIIGLFGADLYLALCLVMAATGLFLAATCVFGMRQTTQLLADAGISEEIAPPVKLGDATQRSASKSDKEGLEILDKALVLEDGYLAENYSLETLANAAGVAPHEASRLLRAHGLSFYDYVNNRRIEEAKRLLSDPQYAAISILSLAHDAGFQSKATFYRVFKRSTGMTPSAFRQQAAPK